jgi:hypothetical protein
LTFEQQTTLFKTELFIVGTPFFSGGVEDSERYGFTEKVDKSSNSAPPELAHHMGEAHWILGDSNNNLGLA